MQEQRQSKSIEYYKRIQWKHQGITFLPSWGSTFDVCFFHVTAMDMKAVKEEIAEEEDDDVPGKDDDKYSINSMEDLLPPL